MAKYVIAGISPKISERIRYEMASSIEDVTILSMANVSWGGMVGVIPGIVGTSLGAISESRRKASKNR